jgi:ubiquitin-specific protease-like protein/BTB/POZ domain-containing protein
MTRYISEDDLKRQKGSRELFNLQPSDALDKFSIVHQKNGTLRVSESVDDTAFFHHRCDDCKLGRALLFVQQYDSTSGLKFVGTLHALSQHSTFEQFLPKLRGILALPDDEPIRVFEDAGDSTVHRVRFEKTFRDLKLTTGDILVVERETEPNSFGEVYQTLPKLPPRLLPHVPIVQNHAARLWETKNATDINLRYGPANSLSLGCHRMILSCVPYFRSLLEGQAFKEVHDPVLDAIYPPSAVEGLIEFIYVGDVGKLLDKPFSILASTVQLADFLNFEDGLKALLDNLSVDILRTPSDIVEAFTVGLSCVRAGKLATMAVEQIIVSKSMLYEEGLVKDFLQQNEEAYVRVMRRIAEELETSSDREGVRKRKRESRDRLVDTADDELDFGDLLFYGD